MDPLKTGFVRAPKRGGDVGEPLTEAEQAAEEEGRKLARKLAKKGGCSGGQIYAEAQRAQAPRQAIAS